MSVQEAQANYDQAALVLHRKQVTETLRQRAGVAYAALTADPAGPYLVSNDGNVIGEVFTTTPGAVLDWHARTLDGEQLPAPYLTARAAAAELARHARSGLWRRVTDGV